MSDQTETMLQSLIEGQKRQAESDNRVLNEVENLRKSFERLHDRFDEIHETSIIHNQKIEVLEGNFNEAKKDCHDEREKIWDKMRQYKKDAIKEAFQKVKLWLYGAFLFGVGGLATSLILAFMTTKIK